MASTWRRRNTSDAWHFCSNCTLWPTSGYQSSSTKPTTGEFCNQCLGKQKAGNCS